MFVVCAADPREHSTALYLQPPMPEGHHLRVHLWTFDFGHRHPSVESQLSLPPKKQKQMQKH
jgi:hypothetical protein